MNNDNVNENEITGIINEEIKDDINKFPTTRNSKEETRCLLITNLQRPFVNSALETLLNKYGAISRFWLDFIKTHCYVEVNLSYNLFSMKQLNKQKKLKNS
jgi:hypothetical protein